MKLGTYGILHEYNSSKLGMLSTLYFPRNPQNGPSIERKMGIRNSNISAISLSIQTKLNIYGLEKFVSKEQHMI